MTVRGEIQADGIQLKVSGSNEVFKLKEAQAVQQQLKVSAGKTVTVDGTLTPSKDVKTVVPLEITAVHP